MKEGQVDFHGDPNLQSNIDKLKDPKPYQEKFEMQEVQQLSQAVDILDKLSINNYHHHGSRVGYEKIRNAQMYLDKLLKQQFDAPEEKTE
jgi:hypothetical protein